jgi:hypothetical protein
VHDTNVSHLHSGIQRQFPPFVTFSPILGQKRVVKNRIAQSNLKNLQKSQYLILVLPVVKLKTNLFSPLPQYQARYSTRYSAVEYSTFENLKMVPHPLNRSKTYTRPRYRTGTRPSISAVHKFSKKKSTWPKD